MTKSRNRSLIPFAFANLEAWPAPDERIFDKVKAAAYRRRKLAVQMYADGMSHAAITEATSLPRQVVCNLVKRCVTGAEDGAIAGFRALIPHQRLAGYTRVKPVVRGIGDGPGGCAGALSLLFSRFPEIEQHVRASYLGDTRGAIPHVRISYTALHGEFLDLLREHGFTDDDWPFNTDNCGYKALRAYCLSLLQEEPTRWFGARAGEEAVRRHGVGSGIKSVFPMLRGYAACQLDFHKVDAASVIVLETEDGARLPVPVARWHIGFLIEERWGLVLGAFAALELNPSSDSVLEVMEAALRPRAESDDTVFCSLTADGKVFPLQIMPELAFQGFSVLKMDNAWSNAATGVVDNIINTVGCAINFGPVKAWWRRHPIERIFGKLTQRGLQRLPSTFGTGPGDTRRDKPLEKAVKFEITISDLLDVIHASIREHNESSNEGINFASPMGALQHSLKSTDSGVFLQPMPRPAQDDYRLLSHVEVATVRGNRDRNVHPYVTLGRWKYSSVALSSNYGLIGRNVLVYCDRRDVQVAHATVLDTGEQLGSLQGPANRRGQHMSWRNRALINQAGLSSRLHANSTSIVSDFCEAKEIELRERNKVARNRKRASKDALAVAKVKADQKRLAATTASREKDVTTEPETSATRANTSARSFAGPVDMPIYVGE
jgi:putative transposase